MSRTYDVAIVGAGILGLAHAYRFACRGMSVLVCERSPRASGASIRNFGMLWPIGQPPGERYDLARKSLSIWLEVLERSGIWHERRGSMHLAYHEDEESVLREFAGLLERSGIDFELLEPLDVLERSPRVRREGLRAGLFSPTETCVDPRQAVRELPEWLAREYGVRFEFGIAALSYERPILRTSAERFLADRLVVCSGDDLKTLYPEVHSGLGLTPCKLQMMRTEPTPGRERLGPMLAAGLTLRHYDSFATCPGLRALKERVAREEPRFDAYGIHVLVSQNGLGEIVIGDSHEYGDAIEPFNKCEIDELILGYLDRFLDVSDLRVASKWNGIYMKNPSEHRIIREPEEGVLVVTGVGGAGMTLSFGVAEESAARFA